MVFCAECDADADQRYYYSWTSRECTACGDGASHAPSWGLLSALGALMVLAVVTTTIRVDGLKAIRHPRWYTRAQRINRICRVKLSTIMFSCQVISHFATVVTSASSRSSSSSGEGYPKIVVTFAAALGLSNLDLVAFVPVGCLAPTTTFYDVLLFKTLAPLGAVALLWTPAAVKHITRKDSTPAARTAARRSFFFMELLVLSVSTTVVSTFICESFDNGDEFLSAHLSVACDGSGKRRFYQGYAICMVLVYPIGKSAGPSIAPLIARGAFDTDLAAVLPAVSLHSDKRCDASLLWLCDKGK